MNVRICHKFALLFVTLAALSASAQYTNRIGGLGPPARQVIVANTNFGVINGTNSQAQGVLDWIDDNWPVFSPTLLTNIPAQVTNAQTLLNWMDTGVVTRVQTNIYYPASNPSNYLDTNAVLALGNTNWLSNTNRILTIPDVTNEIGYAARRFVGFNAVGYGYTYPVSQTTSAGPAQVFGSSGQFATGTYSITAAYGVGAYTNSKVVDTNAFTTSGQLKFSLPGYYFISIGSSWEVPADLADLKFISLSLVHNAGGAAVATLASGPHVEIDPYIGVSGLLYVNNATNVYVMKYESSYVTPKINTSLSVSGTYLGN